MDIKLENISKEDLIKVIAHFYDTTCGAGQRHDLQNYCSVEPEHEDYVADICEASVEHCVKNSWHFGE